METVQVTDNELGKDVVDEDGTKIGIVSAVGRGTAYVDPDPGLTTKLKTKFGWEDLDEEDDYPLREDSIAKITNGEVRVSGDE